MFLSLLELTKKYTQHQIKSEYSQQKMTCNYPLNCVNVLRILWETIPQPLPTVNLWQLDCSWSVRFSLQYIFIRCNSLFSIDFVHSLNWLYTRSLHTSIFHFYYPLQLLFYATVWSVYRVQAVKSNIASDVPSICVTTSNLQIYNYANVLVHFVARAGIHRLFIAPSTCRFDRVSVSYCPSLRVRVEFETFICRLDSVFRPVENYFLSYNSRYRAAGAKNGIRVYFRVRVLCWT